MNAKNKKLLILLIAAIIVAVLAGFLTYRYLTPQKTTIYMFNSNYSAGDVVDMTKLQTVTVDATIMAGGRAESTDGRFVTGNDIGAVLGQTNVLRMDVAAGMPLTYSMLSVTGGSTVETYMDPTKIAVTVAVNGITGVTNDLKAGSRVNVYVSGINEDGITLFLQNMRIISANTTNGSLTSATFECDQNQALKLIYAATYSSIYLGLVDQNSYQYTEQDEPSYVPGYLAVQQENISIAQADGADGPLEQQTAQKEPETDTTVTE